ncbi:MAG: replicative DNA helicase [Paludibacteraceae bacterium]|nr:replicative DNA helicase [Paludibacteraceae bacterium]
MEENQTTVKGTQRKNKNKSNSPVEFEGKLPPHDIQAECAVLGALMIEKEAYYAVSDVLTPECFYDERHNLIYTAIRNLGLNHRPIDMITVVEQLKNMGKLEEAGDYAYITELTSRVSSSAHIEEHAHIVAKKYIARELIRVSSDIIQQSYEQQVDVADVLQQAEGKLFDVSQRQVKKDVALVGTIVEDVLSRIEKAGKSGGLTGIPSGFTDIDKITNGWQKSTLNIIAARPAMGKTAFVLSMAKNMAVSYGKKVAVFSLEMSCTELVQRLLVNISEIEGEKIKRGNLADHEWEQLMARSSELTKADIYIDDTSSLPISELTTKARRLKSEKGIDIIIIDYLQLMTASGMGYGNREQEVALISRSLKQLAKELEIPIIALAQLNRGVETRTGSDKRPQLSDLRESGSIEQDADMVLLIHRPEYYHIDQDENGNSLKGIAEIIIAKHRSGSVGTVQLKFIKHLIKFDNNDQSAGGPLEFDSSLMMGGNDNPPQFTADDNNTNPF